MTRRSWLGFSLVLAAWAQAQYKVVFLDSDSGAELHGASSGNFAGWSFASPGVPHATLWVGVRGQPSDLNPSGYDQSGANCILGLRQGGYASHASGVQAMLWQGTRDSAQPLNPVGFDHCQVFGLSPSNQVGWGSGPATAGLSHALLWFGSSSSYSDLNPTGFTETHAFKTTGGQQIGYGYGSKTGGRNHALLWSSSSTAYVDLNPSGYAYSFGADLASGQQVGNGYGSATGGRSHPLLWYGAANPVTDLLPPGFLYGQAWCTTGREQCGWVWNDPGLLDFKACVWQGWSGSYLDLHAFLPQGHSKSMAFAIDPVTRVVAGLAHDDALDRDEAVLWVPVPVKSGATAH